MRTRNISAKTSAIVRAYTNLHWFTKNLKQIEIEKQTKLLNISEVDLSMVDCPLFQMFNMVERNREIGVVCCQFRFSLPLHVLYRVYHARVQQIMMCGVSAWWSNAGYAQSKVDKCPKFMLNNARTNTQLVAMN